MAASQASSRPVVQLPDWLVQNRNFVLLWLAYGVAAMGDHLSEMALLNTRGGMERTDVTQLQAKINFGFFLPFVILGPIAGWWSDRFSRKWTMIAADLVRAIIVLNMAAIVAKLAHWLPDSWLAVFLPGDNTADYSIVIPLFAIGTLAAFFSPARQAMLPTLVREDQLVRANAMISALGTIGAIISAVLGGWLLKHYGPNNNFLVNTFTFAFSAACVLGISMSRTRAVPHPPLEGVLAPLAAGFRYVRTHSRVGQMILLGSVFWGAAGVVTSVVPAIVKNYYSGADAYEMAGVFRGIMGFGLATGAAVMTILGPALPIPVATIVALFGAGIWLALLAVANGLSLGVFVCGLSLFGIGGAGAALLVTIMATTQKIVPDAKRGRVFGVNDTATMGAMTLATACLALPHIPNLDRYVTLIISATAAVFVIVLVGSWRVYRRGYEGTRPDTWFILRLIRLFAYFWCRAKRVGPCTIPPSGPVILAANHTTGIDPIMIIATSPHRLPAFLVEHEYYSKPLAKYLCDLAACVPVNRESPGKSFYAAALRLLRSGGVLGIFPQGRFQMPDEETVDPLPGIGLIALRTGAPVIPIHISGARYADNPFASFFMRHNVRIRYGKPVDLSRFAGREHDRDAAREATDLIMSRVFELGEQSDGEARPAVAAG